ncbi:M23 family metallopeptidase [Schnuerera sp.]|uniref:murein hydrolase activator EnvC family protein n=1 Tax=Schnuerera sp. TaxID=2794844 RepID=UPI002C4B32C2|nr:M23 family metallopeptidase [Schnuerera sp.]HSH34662.1 M23 family metallopeptidase [Schnuerera sp.]
MYKRRYNIKYKGILNYFKRRLHYKIQLKKVIGVIIILIFILILKIMNNSISSNIIQIIDNGINYEFSIKKDGKIIIDYGKKLLMLPEKTLSVLNISNSTKYQPPIEGVIYSPFGETRYLDGRTTFNNGVDIIPNEDKEPISIEEGFVKVIEDKGTKGYFVTIEHEGMVTVYGYLVSVYIKEGEEVGKGTKIGTLGTNKDGNKYLHFEIWIEGSPVDPLNHVDFKDKL